MCGIGGFMRSCTPAADTATLQRMGESMLHRGPDAGGEYLDGSIGLVHRRLSIIDLSPRGNQPMHSADGRYIIVFNGEIYNFLELRSELEKEGCSFRSGTDTEVILALYAREGNSCLQKLNGMFAFALWDSRERRLLLARDRIGKKPLYYYHAGGDRLAFASEIKPLLLLPEVRREVEPTAVLDYLKYLYIPEGKTIFRGIFKLPPACFLNLESGGEPTVAEYWDLTPSLSRKRIGEPEAAERLRELLMESTACRMIADVPLGAFLSGGIDSSAIVSLMASASAAPVKTCSIGFPDPRHDETTHARRVAALFGTDHREFRMEDRLPETVRLLPRYFDEPFADSSAVPTYHVCRLARESVTVALAGDGGDESFGGYEKYLLDLKEGQVRRFIPRPLLRMALRTPGESRLMRRGRTLAAGALSDEGRAYYRTNTFISCEELQRLVSSRMERTCRGYDPAEHTLKYWQRTQGGDHLTRMLYTDLKTYLPGDILVKVDRMSMAHSLEVRAPFLDYRVVEFAAALPSAMKISRGKKKRVLKRAFAPTLPGEVLHRRKHGFTVPLDSWFRGALHTLAEERLLGNAALAEYFSPPRVAQMWREHQEERCNHGTLLWSLLCFALWHDEYLGGEKGKRGEPCSIT